MSGLSRGLIATIAVAAAAVAVSCGGSQQKSVPTELVQADAMHEHTMGTGTVSKLLGRAPFSDGSETFKIKRIEGDWHMEIKAKSGFDLAVQTITFDVNSQSGWHRHPGPVLIQVTKGEMTFYESDDPKCTPIRRRAGESYLDLGERAHIARNESGAPAENVVAYFAPPGAVLRIDAEKPGNCPF